MKTILSLTIMQAAVDALRARSSSLCTTPAFRAAEDVIAAALLPGSEVLIGHSTTIFPPLSVDKTGTHFPTDAALLSWLSAADDGEDDLPDFCFRVEIPAAYLPAELGRAA
jgi:hypothetical protein